MCWLLLAITGTLLVAPALILSPQLAQAKQGRVIQAIGNGQITCPPGPSGGGYPERISLFVDRNKGDLTGTWNILTVDPSGEGLAFKRGPITEGKIQGNHFTFTGTEEIDELCGAPTAGTTITITGECGQNVPIQFIASNGEQGQFIGNVQCGK